MKSIADKFLVVHVEGTKADEWQQVPIIPTFTLVVFLVGFSMRS